MQRTHTKRPSRAPKLTPRQQNLARPNLKTRRNPKRQMSMKMFNPQLKQLHRDVAFNSPLASDYNYLRSEMATRLLNRISVIRLPFPNVAIIGNDAGGLADNITARYINHKINPFVPKPIKSGFADATPSLDPNQDNELPPTPEEIQDTLNYFARYSVTDLASLTIIDPSQPHLHALQQSIDQKLSILPNGDRFRTNIFPTTLASSSMTQKLSSNLNTIDTTMTNNNINANDSSNVVIATDIASTNNQNSGNNDIVTAMVPSRTQLALTNLTLHWENDLPTIFKSVHDSLAPNGAFVGAMIGGETLRELRSSITLAEMERQGGVTHHVSPFAYTKDIGDLLVKAGFEMVSVDVDTLKIPYPDMFTLVSHIRGMGESHAPFDPSPPMSRDTWLASNAIYETLYRDPESSLLTCTVDVIMFVGWKHHESLNKPAKRGSATAKLGQIVQLPGQTTQKSASNPTQEQQQPSAQEQLHGFFSEIKNEDDNNNNTKH